MQQPSPPITSPLCLVSGGALKSTHSLTSCHQEVQLAASADDSCQSWRIVPSDSERTFNVNAHCNTLQRKTSSSYSA